MKKMDIWGSEREQAEALPCGLKAQRLNEPRIVLRIWKPTAEKPYLHYRYNTIEQRDQALEREIKNFEQHKVLVEDRKVARKGTPEDLEKVKVGDIFHSSWGYDQTNNDFYQVMERKGQMVLIRAIAQRATERETGNGMANFVVAVKDQFLERSKPIWKKISFGYRGEPTLTMSSYSWATPWNGKDCYNSWYA